MENSSSSRKYYEDGSGRVEYNAYNGENYLNSGDIPQPQYIGGLNDQCENKSQCSEQLYCYSGICSHWNPDGLPVKDKSIYIQRQSNADARLCTYKEDCPGGWVCVNQTCQLPVQNYQIDQSRREGFITRANSPQENPPKPQIQKQIGYTSKYRANSGRNYYSYDETM